MYTRSYLNNDGAVSIPENYDGNAFKENSDDCKRSEECESQAAFMPPFLGEDIKDGTEEKEVSTGAFSSFARKLPFGSLFSDEGIFGSLKKGLPSFSSFKIGTEEILIAALALYLFLSKDGDRECAIMLAILLFIH